jgi:alpha-D-ribose 1-methylphosphonate 5-triphosphate synthase subunit PhnL
MQSYFTSGSNLMTIRVENADTSSFTLHYQDMITLNNFTQSITSYTYNDWESLFAFTASLESSSLSSQYRAYITDGTSNTIWNGTIQVMESSSLDKSVYVNQNTSGYISNVTENQYIILT